MNPSRTPIVFLDRLGFDSPYYRSADGASLFPADRFDVRLITSLRKLAAATGDSLESVVGLRSFDEASLFHAAKFQRGFGGVRAERLVVLTERLLLPAAMLREALGIAGDQMRDVLPFRDKVFMKEHLRKRGIRVPRFSPYSTRAALELLEEFGQVVVKPRREAGAKDINFVEHPAGLKDFEDRHAGRFEEFEVEERISGQLYHIDSVVRDSRVVAVTAGKSVDAPTVFSTKSHYRDVEVGPGAVLDRLLAFNEQVISCYEGFTGVTHHEAFVTDDEVVFCEIAARWGGGGIRPAFRFRTGIDLVAAMLAAQLGEPLPVPASPSTDLAGYVLVYVSDQRMLREIALDEPWIIENYVRTRPNQLASAARSWEQAVAVVTVSGKDEAQVFDRLEQAEAEVLSCFG